MARPVRLYHVDWKFDNLAHRASVFSTYEMQQVAPGCYAGTAYGDNGELMAVIAHTATQNAFQIRLSFYAK